MRPRMDEGFSFRAPPVRLRDRIHRRVVKHLSLALLVVVAATGFAQWVIESERRSQTFVDRRSIEPAFASEEASSSTVVVDAPARADAVRALTTARHATRGARTVRLAGPRELSGIERTLVFTDGPSSAEGIVSVAVTGRRWGAAVLGTSGTCYWVSLTHGDASFGIGTGDPCTGVAALAARGPGWS